MIRVWLLFYCVAAVFAGGPEILQKRCISCHNAKARVGGLSLETRGEAARVLEGRLAARVQSGQMPPGGGLPEAERAEIAKWLETGALWTGRLGSGKGLWSLEPVRSKGGSIDGYIDAKLKEKGLARNGEADRRTLIRRITFDLTGLPPTTEEAEAFVASGDYPALVDRLLASPAYGERWGRHWMDVIRFGESNGYEQNHIRPTAWPVRDYFIRAFNDDVPFRDLILHHLAGDLVAKSTKNVDVATGFLVAGPHDTVGNQAEGPKRQQRADDLDDMVNATASAFLGLTVNCAKCHDHKFDPILQSDYYRLAAVFAGVIHGEREVGTEEEKAAYRAKAAPLEKRVVDANARLAELRERAKPGLAAAEARVRGRMREAVSSAGTEEKFAPVRARMVRLALPAEAPGGLDEIEVFSVGGKNLALGARVEASSTRVADGSPDAYAPRLLTDGAFDKRWFAGPGPGVVLTVDLGTVSEISRVVWSSDRAQSQGGRFTVQAPGRYVVSVSTDGTNWTEVATDAGRLPARKEAQDRLFVLEALGTEEFAAAEKELAAAEAELKALPKLERVYAGTFQAKPEPVYLLKGGNVMARGEVMPPGSLSALPGFTLALDAPEGERRLALAKWIGSDTNPLTPRVIVNRLWHYHFGRGLVGTPSDFGFNGERPSHPELLDYLAQRLMDNGWHLKPLHREILLSAAYRQASTWNEAAAKVDADSRLLWRYPPQRMPAEAIRDSMLSVAGVLDRKMGGPSYQLYKYTVDNVATYFPMEQFGRETYRRSVYAQSARSIRTDLLSVYDCPDSSLPEPRRVVTTSPLQALSLLNNAFALDMAKAFGERMAADKDPVGRAFALAFGRGPTAEERKGAEELVSKHGLAALARAIFNTNEFVYVH